MLKKWFYLGHGVGEDAPLLQLQKVLLPAKIHAVLQALDADC
jgi:hypothetical protein